MEEEKEKEYDWRKDPEVKEFKLIIKAILIVALIMLILSTLPSFFALGNLRTNGINDLIYSFENDILYDNPSISESDWDIADNIRRQSYYNGNYSGTYSFENETVGTSGTNITFVDKFAGNFDPITSIISEIDGHKKVLSITSPNNWAGIANNFIDQIIGTVEFWIRPAQANKEISVMLKDNSSWITAFPRAYFQFESDGQISVEGVDKMAYSANKWYHIRMEFDVSDDWHLWVNNIQLADAGGYGFGASITEITHLYVVPLIPATVYLDAIGYDFQTPSEFTFEEFGLYDLFDEYNQTPYRIPDQWEYFNDTSTFAVIDNFQPISGQYLRLYDNDPAGNIIIYQKFNQEVLEGTISMYLRVVQPDLSHSISVPGTQGFGFYTLSNQFVFFDDEIIPFFNYSANIWYDFDITFNLNTDEIWIYIDDNLELYTTISNAEGLLRLEFNTERSDGWPFSYSLDIDEINYNFVGRYSVGDNLISDITYLNTYETNAYDFAFNGIADPTYTGQDDPLGWSDVETTGDDVNIVRQGQDGLVYTQNTNTMIRGIEKGDFNISGIFIDLGVGIEFPLLVDPNGFTQIDIHSLDDTLTTRLRFYVNGDFSYYDGTSYIVLNTEIEANEAYQVDFNINYELDWVFLSFYIQHPIYWWQFDLFDTYDFPLIIIDKSGLTMIEIESHTFSVNNLDFLLDYVKISTNNTYYPNEFTYISILMNASVDIRDYNLFTTTIVGDIGLSISEIGFEILGVSVMDNRYYTTPQTITVNIYEGFLQVYGNATFVIYLKTDFLVYSLHLEGVVLVQDTNEYRLKYSFGGVNSEDNYFYASGGNLYYILFTNKSELEFIGATFDISNIPTNNYSLLWGGIENIPEIFSEFRINYLDTTYSSHLLTSYYQMRRDFFGLEKTITNIQFIISDNSKEIHGNFGGYLESFTFIWNPDTILDITLVNYLVILSPALIISVITIVIWQMTKKKVETMLIVPSMALMSFLCFIADFIPLWMLFVMLVSGGVLVYSKWKNLFMIFSSFITMITAFLVFGAIIDLWLFYLSFLLMMSYVIFLGVEDIKGGRE